jgi:hypothetical protein
MNELCDAIADPSWWRARCDDAFNDPKSTLDEMNNAGLHGIGFATIEQIDFTMPLDMQAKGLVAVWLVLAPTLDDFITSRTSDGAIALRGLLDRIEVAAVVLALHGEDAALRAITWHAALRNKRLGIKPLPRIIIEGGDEDVLECGAIVALENEYGNIVRVEEFAA